MRQIQPTFRHPDDTGGAVEGEPAEPGFVDRLALHPAQQGPDPRLQLLGIEGFDQIVVGAEVESRDPIADGGAGGDHQHGHLVAAFSQPVQKRRAIPVGQAKIQQDQVVPLILQHLPRLQAGGQAVYGMALAAQAGANGLGDPGGVFDDQDAHRSPAIGKGGPPNAMTGG